LAAATLSAQAPATPAQAPTIPKVSGLTMTSVLHEERGDYESLVTMTDARPDQFTLEVTSDIPNASDPSKPKRLDVVRRVRMADDSSAHRLNMVVATDDPEIFPGSTVGFSRAMFADVGTTGKTSVAWGDAPPNAFSGLMALTGAVRKYYRGDLVRVGRTTFPIIINSARVQVPAIELKGHLVVGTDADDVDLLILDNAASPITLKWAANGRTVQTTQIEWEARPGDEGPGRKPHFAGMDATACRTEVHGIYFSFNSAVLVPESDRALKQIADMMAANPTWIITIEGHTDSIGGTVSNQLLSERRSAAVRDALVNRFGVAATRLTAVGYGDKAPIEPNRTIEGRARNRRVELARKC